MSSVTQKPISGGTVIGLSHRWRFFESAFRAHLVSLAKEEIILNPNVTSMKQKILTLAVLCLASYLPSPKLAAQTNLVGAFNPGYESNFTGWGGSGFANASIDTVNPGEGIRAAKLAASSGNNWNTLVNTAGTIQTVPGRSYQLSALTRQNLVGGTASLGFCELNSSMVATHYLWKVVSNSTNWHSEYLTLNPRSDTSYLRIYLIVSSSATSGFVWWDNFRAIEVSPTAMTSVTSPFVDDTTAAIDVAPLPVSTFTRAGLTISPTAMVPAVKFGNLLVGGTLSWKVVTEASGPSGTAILQGASAISHSGPWGWTIDLNSAASSLTPGNYLLVINAVNRDQTITRDVSKLFTIQ